MEGELVPALNKVGEGFEKKNGVLAPASDERGSRRRRLRSRARAHCRRGRTDGKGTVVIATVQGDIHDIGKNIVRALLENYGYTVVDLGKDVPPETVLEAVRRSGAPLVGLSALMTTTVESMEKTIRLLRAQANVKIVVGGAVLTEDYALRIGADFYGPRRHGHRARRRSRIGQVGKAQAMGMPAPEQTGPLGPRLPLCLRAARPCLEAVARRELSRPQKRPRNAKTPRFIRPAAGAQRKHRKG